MNSPSVDRSGDHTHTLARVTPWARCHEGLVECSSNKRVKQTGPEGMVNYGSQWAGRSRATR